jgi:hypothetical protein
MACRSGTRSEQAKFGNGPNGRDRLGRWGPMLRILSGGGLWAAPGERARAATRTRQFAGCIASSCRVEMRQHLTRKHSVGRSLLLMVGRQAVRPEHLHCFPHSLHAQLNGALTIPRACDATSVAMAGFGRLHRPRLVANYARMQSPSAASRAKARGEMQRNESVAEASLLFENAVSRLRR